MEDRADVSFLLLLQPRDTSWGIYLYHCTVWPQDGQGRPVSHRLDSLLQSAKDYPPALALARHYLSRLDEPGWDLFEELACHHLEVMLTMQRKVTFKLASALTDNRSQFDGDGYYWVIRNSRDRYGYYWVTRDYVLDEAQSCDFDIDPTELDEMDLNRLKSRLQSSGSPD